MDVAEPENAPEAEQVQERSPKRRKVDVNGNPVDAAKKIVEQAKDIVDKADSTPKRYNGDSFLLEWLSGEWEHDIEDINMTVVNGS